MVHATFSGNVADILPEAAPRRGEPVVTSGPDKFVGTDLEKILNTYIEQYVTYQLVNGPRLGPAVTLTKFDLVKF